MAMSTPKRTASFTVTDDHLKLLRAAYVGWDDGEYGAPAIDCKRPYGNSSGDADVARILGVEMSPDDDETAAKMRAIHEGTMMALQIVLVTGEFRTGTFRLKDRYSSRSWIRVDDQAS